MDDRDSLHRTLSRAKRALQILDEEAAGYTALTRPAHLQIEIEEQHKEVASLEARLAQLDGRRAAAVPDNLLGRPPIFVGRKEEMARCLASLSPEERGWGVTIDGIGGMGKTALALEVAYAGWAPAPIPDRARHGSAANPACAGQSDRCFPVEPFTLSRRRPEVTPMLDPEPTPRFTPAAAALWRNVPAWAQARVLANVFCSRCRHATTIIDFRGEVVSGDLLLTGACQVCGTTVRRLIESESEP